MTYWDEHGPWGNETRSENVGYDGDGRVVKKDDAENNTTWHYVVSSVTGQKITDVVYDGTWGLTHIYMGSTLIAETGSEDYLLFKTTDPVTGGTQDIDPDGTAPNNETSRNELAALDKYFPLRGVVGQRIGLAKRSQGQRLRILHWTRTRLPRHICGRAQNLRRPNDRMDLNSAGSPG